MYEIADTKPIPLKKFTQHGAQKWKPNNTSEIGDENEKDNKQEKEIRVEHEKFSQYQRPCTTIVFTSHCASKQALTVTGPS